MYDKVKQNDIRSKEMFLVTWNRKLSSFLIGAFLVLALAACGNESEGDVAAVVNGTEISMDEFNQNYESQKERLSQSIDMTDELETTLKKDIIDLLINTELVLQKAEEENIKAPEEKVNEQFNGLKEQIGEDKFTKALEENNVTEEEAKEGIRENLLIEQYFKENTESAKVTEKELQDAYEQMKKDYEETRKQTEEEMPEVPKFEDAKQNLEQQLLREKEMEQQQNVVNKLREESEIDIKVEA
ncbi:SurA N-terminal domain-containing protein [Pontibacillus litoralis]|uniref:SurA N-terminal domain-containing protein n=1 Tax=Pontibacillus litoralis TaxID=516703 RepID=UPI0022B72518|nr:SurA N-terminal domain-containing protein [Pontibacillus litoralis]